jgi:uncharacterized protein YqgC (DUF456 family)
MDSQFAQGYMLGCHSTRGGGGGRLLSSGPLAGLFLGLFLGMLIGLFLGLFVGVALGK